ncbi:MAG: hypothetical protein AAF745_01695 [Planctomycetota bacterium]
MPILRRRFLKATSAAAMTTSLPRTGLANESKPIGKLETMVPCRAITRGPMFHWFGYYDKREFDPTGQLVLSNEVAFEGRSPNADDTINVGYIDTANGDAWHSIGTSAAWGWQQGCMLQWVGDDGRQILWNDRDGDQHVCRIHTIDDGVTRTIDRPIYTLSQDGRFGLSLDFRRIQNLRPGYGYVGLADPHVRERAPGQSGVWKVDLETGNSQLILSLADVARIAWPDGAQRQSAWHYFNHCLINPSGTRFVVLHRYRPKFDPDTLTFQGPFVTRMISGNLDGSDIEQLDPSGHTSHFIWKDDQTLTMWTRPDGRADGFYDFVDQADGITPVGQDAMPANGHNTYLPPPYQDWILNDTYPSKRDRRQTVYLFHRPTGKRVDLGHFPSPHAYRGEWRCDTHPRCSDDGLTVAIDSPHAQGRQVYLLDVSDIVTAGTRG